MPNKAVQRTPLARCVGWARFTRQTAPACWQHDNAQPSSVRGDPRLLPLNRSAARTLPGTCLFPLSSTLHTPASGAANACLLGRIKISVFTLSDVIDYTVVSANRQATVLFME